MVNICLLRSPGFPFFCFWESKKEANSPLNGFLSLSNCYYTILLTISKKILKYPASLVGTTGAPHDGLRMRATSLASDVVNPSVSRRGDHDICFKTCFTVPNPAKEIEVMKNICIALCLVLLCVTEAIADDATVVSKPLSAAPANPTELLLAELRGIRSELSTMNTRISETNTRVDTLVTEVKTLTDRVGKIEKPATSAPLVAATPAPPAVPTIPSAMPGSPPPVTTDNYVSASTPSAHVPGVPYTTGFTQGGVYYPQSGQPISNNSFGCQPGQPCYNQQFCQPGQPCYNGGYQQPVRRVIFRNR